MRLAALAPALALAALALGGCESSQERNAQLERAFKAHQAAQRLKNLPLDGLSVARRSTKALVGETAVLHSSEGAAVVVQVHNVSGTALRDVPIEFDVTDAAGRTLYTNDLPGLSPTLVSIALLAPHASVDWIDDQVQLSGSPSGVSVRIGEGEAVGAAAIPALQVNGKLVEEAGSVGYEGSVGNASSVTQRELLVDCLARRGGRIVAAGRAVVPEAPAHGSAHFELFFIGEPKGATLQTSAPATRTS